MSPHYRLFYFPARNQGEAIRLAFHYAGVPFEDFKIPLNEWAAKYKASSPYGTVPYLEIDNEKLAEVTTILRYIGRHYGLAGSNPCEEAKVDELLQVHHSEYSEMKKWLLAKQ
ncbi:Glutathione S-transferase [Aphelenchoides fujianensis]|nr:Glutathione S-transferase [Aphelenchoides fujianensis]